MNELTPFATSADWFDFINFWLLALPCGIAMVTGFVSIMAGMISEQWHDSPRYLHEHDANWIKENVK